MSGLRDALLELGGDLAGSLEDVLVPAALLDADGTVRWQNKASLALRGSLVGRSYAELVLPGERTQAHDLLTHILCAGEPAELTLTLPTRDGYARAQLSAVPVREGGAVVGVFGLGRPEVGVAEPVVPPPRPGAELTPRQLDVLRLLADGLSTHEIATELSLSTTTVRNHVSHILAALGVHSRLQAVVAASRAGLLPRR